MQQPPSHDERSGELFFSSLTVARQRGIFTRFPGRANQRQSIYPHAARTQLRLESITEQYRTFALMTPFHYTRFRT